MNNNKRKMIITAIVTIVLAIVSAIWGVNYSERDVAEISNSVETVVNTVDNIVDNQSTTEIPEGTEQEEKQLEVQEVENESFELQGEIAYNGDKSNKWNLKIGSKPQLTYISQIDSRWRYYPYTSIGISSQTIGSSGCGVASATMIIDSIVGNVSITELADCFVANGYRSANSGTYWSAYRAVADEFNIEYTETSNFDTMLNLLTNNHYIIASCGNGLFTSGGHYIVIYGIDRDTLKIYDPYLYSGKFDTSTRRGKATVNGNTVYVTVDNFKKYANYKQFFCYGYDENSVNTTNSTDKDVATATYTRYVATQSSNLNVRNAPNGSVISSLKKGTAVKVVETNRNWSRISNPTTGWVSNSYLSSTAISNITIKGYTTGTYKTTANLHVRTGAGTNYTAKTYKQLTSNARSQNRRLGNYYYNGYKKGVTCTVTQVSGNWGKTASSWICLDYCKKQ